MVARLDLEEEEVERWAKAAERMFIPYEEHLGMHPQDAHFLDREVWDLEETPAENRPLLLHYHPLVIYRFQVIKQADVVLALFLRGDEFTVEEKRANFEYYDPITTGDSSLSSVVQSIIAAEVGYHELALRYFYQSMFVDLADLQGNACDGVHVASTGGVWSALVYGFGGFRDTGSNYRIDPRLPEAWTSITYRITLQGARVRCSVDHDEVRLSLETGEQAQLTVRGKQVQITADEPVVVPLDGMGPRLPGNPPVWGRDGVRRSGRHRDHRHSPPGRRGLRRHRLTRRGLLRSRPGRFSGMRTFTTFDQLSDAVGEDLGTTDWLEIDPGPRQRVRRRDR